MDRKHILSLTEELLLRGTLKVIDRKSLPNEQVRKEDIVEVITNQINLHRRFPNTDIQDIWDGGLIIQETDGYLFIRKAEIGICKYDVVDRQKYSSLYQACIKFIESCYPKGIDGVKII